MTRLIIVAIVGICAACIASLALDDRTIFFSLALLANVVMLSCTAAVVLREWRATR